MVTMYTQLLLRRRPSSDDEREYSRYIRDGVERVTALIDGMITYSRNLRTPADLSSCAEAAGAAQAALKSLAESIAESGAEVTVDWLPSVRIDQTALIDVFQHLLLNALEYTREGVPARIHLSAVRNRDEICFSVRDNGIGIDPAHHAQIFLLFRRLHGAEHPGIGVGLPLCRRLIENYGGQLWLKSEPGIGSIFYFTLRAADRAASSAG
jgi:signal transduction histidine kinase